MSKDLLKFSNGVKHTPLSADPTSPTDGVSFFSDGTSRAKGLWEYKDGAWTQLAGGGVDTLDLDIFHQDNFETTTASDATKGLNPTYLTAGPFGGVLSDETTSPISGTSCIKYTVGVTSTNDWFDFGSKSLDRKQRGTDVYVGLWTEATDMRVDFEFVVWDITNGKKLTTILDVIPGGSGRQAFNTIISTPENCTAISYGFHMINGPTNSDSFLFSDIQLSTRPNPITNILDTQTLTFEALASTMTTTSSTLRFGTIISDGSDIISYDDSNGRFTSSRNVSVDLTCNLRSASAHNLTILNQSSVIVGRSSASANRHSNLSIPFTMVANEYYTLKSDNAADTSRFTYLHITATATSEYIVIPAKSNMSGPVVYTPTFTGFGTVTAVDFTWARIGKFMRISGKFTTGGVAAVEAKITLPNGLTVDSTVPSGMVIAGSWARNGAIGDHFYPVIVGGEDNFGIDSQGNTTPAAVKGNGNYVGSSEIQTMEVTIPIEEWSNDVSFSVAVPVQKVAIVKELKSGDAGGSAVNTSQTRVLNTIEGDNSFLSIDSNQLTINLRGIYVIEYEAPAFRVNTHQTYLYSINDGVTVSDGQPANSPSTGSQSTSRGIYFVILTEAHRYELRQFTSLAVASFGLGVEAASFGGNPAIDNVYAQIKVTKIK